MIKSEIKYFELEDGEHLYIQQYVDGELHGEILMHRKVAIDLAKEILEMLSHDIESVI